MSRPLRVEVHLDGIWKHAATLELEDSASGYEGGGRLSYEFDYIAEHLGRTEAAVSCRYPVSYATHTFRDKKLPLLDEESPTERGWPAFLLDILPQGFGRRMLLDAYAHKKTPPSEVALLLEGGSNPTGNLRIREGDTPMRAVPRHGFSREEIDERSEAFVALARDAGVLLPGTSGVQGDAPKMLMVLGNDGQWYADGTLEESETVGYFLIKMKRGKDDRDLEVLRNERAYMEVARLVGLRANEPLQFHKRTLFVPRFDRRSRGERIGQESLLSLAGINEYGTAVPLMVFCEALTRYSTAPTDDVTEFVLRDLLNYALGNTDNHGRNTAVQRLPRGAVRLSPLFDFAPMFHDPEGIPRRFRWEHERTRSFDVPSILAELSSIKGIDHRVLAQSIQEIQPRFEQLALLMVKAGVEEHLIEARRSTIKAVAQSMKQVR